MGRLNDFAFRLRSVVARRRLESELDEEIAFHLDQETAKNERAGMDPHQARVEARRRFGGQLRHRESTRVAWGTAWLLDAVADARFAVRRMVADRMFTLVAVTTLALGIGGTVALLSVARSLLLQPLPVADEERLVRFWSDYDWRGVEYDFALENTSVYDGLAAFSTGASAFLHDDRTALLETVVGSASLFDVLGVRPQLGRTFRPGEDRGGAEPVVVVSHGFWQQQLGGDEEVVGQRIQLDGEPVTVIGVMPRGFYFPSPQYPLWRPLNLDPSRGSYTNNGWLVLLGRLRDGVGVGELDADVARLAAALGDEYDYPEAWDKSQGAFVEPLRDYLLGSTRPPLLLLLGAAGLLLLLATANVAALMMARLVQRRREFAARASLGAARWRLVRQLLVETLMLGAVASLLGALLAMLSFDALLSALPLGDDLAAAVALDWTLLLWTMGAAIAVALVVSAAPIRRVLAGHSEQALRSRSGGTEVATARFQGAMVAVEVALAVVLVVGAALLVRSVSGLYDLETGVAADDVVALDLLLPTAELEVDQLRTLYDQLAVRAAALPGVERAALINRLPLRDGGYQGPIGVEDRPDLEGAKRPNSYYRVVTPDLFRTLGIDLIEGRTLLAEDRADGEQVALVSASFAREMWPDRSAIGRRLSRNLEGSDGWVTVVGVVEDVRLTGVRDDAPRVTYRSLAQLPQAAAVVLVARSTLDPAAVVEMLRGTVSEIDPRVAVGRVTTMPAVVDLSISEPLRLRFFLVLFGGLALLIGMAGVYGVVSYTASSRRAEYGVRAVLGASPPRLLGVVMRSGMLPVAMGVLVGGLLSRLGARWLDGFLFGIEASDPSTLLWVAALLLLVGALATFAPAIRASLADPVKSLRTD